MTDEATLLDDRFAPVTSSIGFLQAHHADVADALRQFEMFGPLATDFINYVRTVSLVRDGARWRFDAAGTVQGFEDTDAYKRRKVTDRFTPQMLVAYAAELGLRPFDDDFYPGPSTLASNPATVPPGCLSLSIDMDGNRADHRGAMGHFWTRRDGSWPLQ